MKLGQTTKIKFQPEPEGKQIIDHWLTCARLVYNLSVDILNSYESRKREIVFDVIEKMYENEKKRSEDASLLEVFRDRYRFERDINHNIAFKNVPQFVYDNSVRKLIKAKFADDCSRWNGNMKGDREFNKKEEKDKLTIEVNRRDWNGERGTKICEKLVEHLGHLHEYFDGVSETAIEITRDRLKTYYINVSCDGELNEPTLCGGYHYTAVLDPGEVVFNTLYDVDGQVIQYATRDDFMKKIMPTLLKVDQIQSKMDTFKRQRTKNGKKKSKTSMRLAMLRTYQDVRNKVDEMHKQFASYLCNNYKVVLLPEFKTSGMVGKDKVLHSKVVRRMLTWSHFRFKMHLKQRALRSGTLIVDVDEHFTSKTCGYCGCINNKDTNMWEQYRIFRCSNCGIEIDRDMNGARNILLRYLTINNIHIV